MVSGVCSPKQNLKNKTKNKTRNKEVKTRRSGVEGSAGVGRTRGVLRGGGGGAWGGGLCGRAAAGPGIQRGKRGQKTEAGRRGDGVLRAIVVQQEGPNSAEPSRAAGAPDARAP